MLRSSIIRVSFLVLSFLSCVAAYASPELNRKAMAGVWRLSSKRCFLPLLETVHAATQGQQQYPMKEFTVYPKKNRSPPPPPVQEEADMLLKLNEDGSFTQCGDTAFDIDEGEEDSDDETEEEEQRPKFGIIPKKQDETIGSVMGIGAMKGTWDFLDGKLILAADRPKDADSRNVHDTLLVGQVVATSEQSLADNPALGPSQNRDAPDTKESSSKEAPASPQKESEGAKKSSSSSPHSSSMDVHLSVPEGSVEIGKFIYPKNHPSFFEQPMFESTPTGTFQLRQVLGSLNAKSQRDEEEYIEKFKKEDLMGKRYLLTSYPLKPKPKGKMRWSIKYNKMVEDKNPKKGMEEEEAELNTPMPIRCMEVELFANNTFTTHAGLGSSLILRGKWYVIGNNRDQLWMQVWRFGFGRSVSGSTYSEGTGLTHNDEKVYWGKIYEVDHKKKEDDTEGDEEKDSEGGKKVEINGAVMMGWGLEPCSVARFTMIEKTEDSFIDDDEEDDDDGDDDDDDDEAGYHDIELKFFDENEGEDDSTSSDFDSFSSPDAFQ